MTKKRLKSIAQNVAFNQLLLKQSSHKKVSYIIYKTFETQPYIKSSILTKEEIKTLTAIRSHCLHGIKQNFPKTQKLSEYCPLKCGIGEAQSKDTQEHLLQCKVLGDESNINTSCMYSEDVVEQAKIAKLTLKLKRKREHILEELENSLQRLPGALFLDPSIQLHQQMGAAYICND